MGGNLEFFYVMPNIFSENCYKKFIKAARTRGEGDHWDSKKLYFINWWDEFQLVKIRTQVRTIGLIPCQNEAKNNSSLTPYCFKQNFKSTKILKYEYRRVELGKWVDIRYQRCWISTNPCATRHIIRFPIFFHFSDCKAVFLKKK